PFQLHLQLLFSVSHPVSRPLQLIVFHKPAASVHSEINHNAQQSHNRSEKEAVRDFFRVICPSRLPFPSGQRCQISHQPFIFSFRTRHSPFSRKEFSQSEKWVFRCF